MKLVQYLRNYFVARKTAKEETSRQYEKLFRRCYEGTEAEVERRIDNLDWVLRTTRN